MRAEAILRDGPDPRYSEAAGERPAEGFSTAPAQGPFGFGNPETVARNKHTLFPGEGGPVILEFEIPDELAAVIIGDVGKPVQPGRPGNWGDEINFDIGYGIEPLLEVWQQLKKSLNELGE